MDALITSPLQVSDLMRGRIDRFSSDCSTPEEHLRFTDRAARRGRYPTLLGPDRR
jgi:hypothetical protein